MMKDKFKKILQAAAVKDSSIEKWISGLDYLSDQDAELLADLLANATKEEVVQISELFEMKIEALGKKDPNLLRKIIKAQKELILK